MRVNREFFNVEATEYAKGLRGGMERLRLIKLEGNQGDNAPRCNEASGQSEAKEPSPCDSQGKVLEPGSNI